MPRDEVKPTVRLKTAKELVETPPVVFDVPFESDAGDATGVSKAATVCVFVRDGVGHELRRFGQHAPEYAGVVYYEASIPASVIAESGKYGKVDLQPLGRPPADMGRLLGAVCKGAPGMGSSGRACLFPAAPRDWDAAVRAGTFQAAIALADADRRVIAWIPFVPTEGFMTGKHVVETIAVLSVRGLVQRITLDWPLLYPLTRRAGEKVRLRVEAPGSFVREWQVTMRALREVYAARADGAPGEVGDLPVFLAAGGLDHGHAARR